MFVARVELSLIVPQRPVSVFFQKSASLPKQVGERPGLKGAGGGGVLPLYLPGLPEGGAVDDLGSEASTVQPRVDPAQRRLPVNALALSCPAPLPCVAAPGRRVQKPQGVEAGLENSG